MNYYDDLGQHYPALLYCSLFALVYYGLLRVGELTSGPDPVFATDVQIAFNKKKMKFILHKSKMHWQDAKPQIIKITSSRWGYDARNEQQKSKLSKSRNAIHCPYFLLTSYSNTCPSWQDLTEPFFILSRAVVNSIAL